MFWVLRRISHVTAANRNPLLSTHSSMEFQNKSNKAEQISRMFTPTKEFEDITEELIYLHWLPVEYCPHRPFNTPSKQHNMLYCHLKRLSTIEPCKIENLCLKLLLNFFVFCWYFGNIFNLWYHINVAKFHISSY